MHAKHSAQERPSNKLHSETQRQSKITQQKCTRSKHDELIICNVQNDKFDLHVLREQMHNLLDQIGSLRSVLKDHSKADRLQSDELNRLRSVNEELLNVDRRMAYTWKSYQKMKSQNEEINREHALDDFKINALQSEIDSLKAQLDTMSKVVKEKESRISEMNQYHLSLSKKNEDLLAKEIIKLNSTKENRLADLQKNQLTLLQKNDAMVVEISRLHREMCHMEQLLLAEQDSRKNEQQQLFSDVQLAHSSLLQKNDTLSDEVARLKTKLDSSSSFTKSSQIHNIDNIENMDDLSVETIRDVESLRRAISKLVPAYGHSLGGTKVHANEVLTIPSKNSKGSCLSTESVVVPAGKLLPNKTKSKDEAHQQDALHHQPSTRQVLSLKPSHHLPERKNANKERYFKQGYENTKLENQSRIIVRDEVGGFTSCAKTKTTEETENITRWKHSWESSSFTHKISLNSFPRELAESGYTDEENKERGKRNEEETKISKTAKSATIENTSSIPEMKQDLKSSSFTKAEITSTFPVELAGSGCRVEGCQKKGERKAEASHISVTVSSAKTGNALTLVKNPALSDQKPKTQLGGLVDDWMIAEVGSIAKGAFATTEPIRGESREAPAEDRLLVVGRLQESRLALSGSMQCWAQENSPTKNSRRSGKNGSDELCETSVAVKLLFEPSFPTELGTGGGKKKTMEMYSSNDAEAHDINNADQTSSDAANTYFQETSQFPKNSFSSKTGNSITYGKDHNSRILVEALLPTISLVDDENQDATELAPFKKLVHSISSTAQRPTQGDWRECWEENLFLLGGDRSNKMNELNDGSLLNTQPEIPSGSTSYLTNEEKQNESNNSLVLIPEEIDTHESDSPVSSQI